MLCARCGGCGRAIRPLTVSAPANQVSCQPRESLKIIYYTLWGTLSCRGSRRSVFCLLIICHNSAASSEAKKKITEKLIVAYQRESLSSSWGEMIFSSFFRVWWNLSPYNLLRFQIVHFNYFHLFQCCRKILDCNANWNNYFSLFLRLPLWRCV